MMAALWAFIYMDWINSMYNAVSPQLVTFLQSEEFYLPFGAISLTATAVLIGWYAKALATGHRQRNAKALAGEEKNMKVARQLRQEDAILKAIDSMIADKTMSHRQAKNAFREYANKMGLTGLLFRAKEYKKLDKFRLKTLREKTLKGLATLKETPVIPTPTGVVVPLTRTRVKVAA